MELKTILQLSLGIILILCAIAIIIVIVLQEGNQHGLGSITGGADTFFSKNKARSIDAFLSRWTKAFALIFVLMVIALNCVEKFMA